MNPPGRPQDETRSAQHEAAPVSAAAVVEAQNLSRTYTIRRGLWREPAKLQAVGGVSFRIEAGRTLAVVG